MFSFFIKTMSFSVGTFFILLLVLISPLKAAEEGTNSIALEYAHSLCANHPEVALFLGLEGYENKISFLALQAEKNEKEFHEGWAHRLQGKIEKFGEFSSLESLSLQDHAAYVELLNLKEKCENYGRFLDQACLHGFLMVPNPYFQGMVDDFNPVSFILMQFLMAQKQGIVSPHDYLAFYLETDDSRASFIERTQYYLEQKIRTFKANKQTILYPSKSRVQGIIDYIQDIRKNMSFILKESSPTPLSLKFWKQATGYLSFLKEDVLPNATEANNLPLPLYEAYLKLYGVQVPLFDLKQQAYQDYEEATEDVNGLLRELAPKHDLIGDPAALWTQLNEKLTAESSSLAINVLKEAARKSRSSIKKNGLFPYPSCNINFRESSESDRFILPGSRCIIPKIFGREKSKILEVMVDTRGKECKNPLEAFIFMTHTGQPGHGLQFLCSMVQQRYLRSPLVFNLSSAEGWACYAAHSLFPYCDSLEQKLSIKKSQQVQALKTALCLEIMMQTKTEQEVINDLVEILKITPREAENSVNSFSGLLGFELIASYSGEKIVKNLKETLSEKLGSDFRLEIFHEAILKAGFISFELSCPLIERHFSSF